jgi:TPR repeat protein
MFSLGVMHYNGMGVRQSYVQAEKWFGEAARRGQADAQVMMGYMCFHGDGRPQPDYTGAAHWFNEAATQGHPDALYALAYMYGSGIGVTQDPEEAKRMLTRAALAGMRRAHELVGTPKLEEAQSAAEK